ncbi:hypothetical protein [Paenibacillus illinoisensis]|uniref:hypothetical protein n=1 Tax=Paenibacillus illinoisensis TaxID=59845 RepID=UPI00301B08EF
MTTNKNIIAITGATGTGKTRLISELANSMDVSVPRHTTNRLPRNDDEVGFYNYIDTEEFKRLEYNNEFLFSSGDIKRYYGVLKKDAENAWFYSNSILVTCSYKDLSNIKALPYYSEIIVLAYKDMQTSIVKRTESRKWPDNELLERIKEFSIDETKFKDDVEKCASNKFYVDDGTDFEEILLVCKNLIKRCCDNNDNRL